MSLSRQTDDELMSAIARKDRKAFAALFERHQQSAYALACHLTHRHDQAEEALQEAMLRLWNRAHAYRPGNARAYLLRIVARESIRLRRQQHREDRKSMEREVARPSENASPARDAEQAETFAALKAALSRIGQEDGDLVMLAVGAGMTHKEIGELYQVPRRTVSDRVQSALERLRVELKRMGIPHLAAGGTAATALQEALLAGPSAPPGLAEQVMSGLNAANHSMRAASMQTGKAGMTGKVIAGVVVLIAAAAGWMAYGPAPAAPSNPAAVPTSRPAEKPARFERLLTFERAEDYDLVRFDKGRWSRVDQGGVKNSAALKAESDPLAQFTFKLPELKLPLRIDMDLCPVNIPTDNYFDNGFVAMFQGKSALASFKKSIVRISRPGTWLKCRFYISKNGTDLYLQDRRTHLILGTPRLLQDSLGMTFKGTFIIDNIHILEISDEDVPSLEPYQSSLNRIPLDQRNGIVPAPGLKDTSFEFDDPAAAASRTPEKE